MTWRKVLGIAWTGISLFALIGCGVREHGREFMVACSSWPDRYSIVEPRDISDDVKRRLRAIDEVLTKEFGDPSGVPGFARCLSADGVGFAVVRSDELSHSPVRTATTLWWPDWRNPERYERASGYIIPIGHGGSVAIDGGVMTVRSHGERITRSAGKNAESLSGAACVPFAASPGALVEITDAGRVRVRRDGREAEIGPTLSSTGVRRIGVNADASRIAVILGDGRTVLIDGRDGRSAEVPGELALGEDGLATCVVPGDHGTIVRWVTVTPDLGVLEMDSEHLSPGEISVSPSGRTVLASVRPSWSKNPSTQAAETEGADAAHVFLSIWLRE